MQTERFNLDEAVLRLRFLERGGLGEEKDKSDFVRGVASNDFGMEGLMAEEGMILRAELAEAIGSRQSVCFFVRGVLMMGKS